MNTCWALNSWATGSWAANTWAAITNLVLFGDITTAFGKWMAANLEPSYTTRLQQSLATRYGYTPPVDTSSLLSRFLRNRV